MLVNHPSFELPNVRKSRLLFAALAALIFGCKPAVSNDTPAAGGSVKTELPERTLQAMASALDRLTQPSSRYPWKNLESLLHQFPNEKLPLIGYGSLLNPKSAARTIANTPDRGHPAVVAMGAIRLFNYRMPPSALARYPLPPEPAATAALNLEYSRSSAHLFNGRLIFVAAGDVKGLREREKGYDLEPVVYVPWAKWEATPKVAYVLVARNILGRPVVVDSNLRPHEQYAALCLEGARVESPAFADFYLKTTFLADRVTSLWQITHNPTSPKSDAPTYW